MLNFTVTGDEVDSYMSMLTYLVKKHRCGVINCCFPGMKDMYLVPLQGDAPIPPQLLPLDGPGNQKIDIFPVATGFLRGDLPILFFQVFLWSERICYLE